MPEASKIIVDGQHVLDVPGDGLAFAVRVGRQEQALGGFQRGGDLGDLGLAARVAPPDHGEVLIRQDGAILLDQVAHMAEGSEHDGAAAEILLDGLGLGRRFDDEDISHG